MDPSWLYRGNIFFVVFPFVMPKREMKNQKRKEKPGGRGMVEEETERKRRKEREKIVS